MAAERNDLIRNVWPDKLLYASIMLLVTGLIGALHAAIVRLVGIKVSAKLPALLRAYPIDLTLALSIATVVLAYLAIRQVRTLYALLGAAAGVASLGLYGVGSLFAVVAAGFLVVSVLEKEEQRVREAKVGPESWPDKTLAASLLLLVAGGITLLWGLAVLTGNLVFMGSLGRAFGVLQILLAAVCLAAAWQLYHQKGEWLGVGAGVAAIVGFGGYVLAPALGIAALVAIRKAQREGEFEPDAPAARDVAPAAR